MARTVFSGIKPSGNPHLGNYIGAIKHWVAAQDEPGQHFYCIVDLHAITVDQDPTQLRESTLQLAGLLIACGIDSQKSTLFIQSHNPDHANLGWILNCYTSMGQMNRMTQYKEKSEGKEFVSVGLFDYPALMAADILLYDTTEVPVGEDQKQHVELTRDIATRFNSRHGETFVLPKPVIPPIGGRVMSLSDPSKKMSKSISDPNGTIDLLDDADLIHKKVMSAITDSENNLSYDENRPGVANLIEIYSQVTGTTIADTEQQFITSGYGDFKKAVAEAVIALLTPIQARYQQLRSTGELEEILRAGKEKAYNLSHPKLQQVYDKIGFVS